MDWLQKQAYCAINLLCEHADTSGHLNLWEHTFVAQPAHLVARCNKGTLWRFALIFRCEGAVLAFALTGAVTKTRAVSLLFVVW